MQALVLEAFSGYDAMAVRDVPAPGAAGDGAVLVDVHAVAFGPWNPSTARWDRTLSRSPPDVEPRPRPSARPP